MSYGEKGVSPPWSSMGGFHGSPALQGRFTPEFTICLEAPRFCDPVALLFGAF
jgi:hypothetical protein